MARLVQLLSVRIYMAEEAAVQFVADEAFRHKFSGAEWELSLSLSLFFYFSSCTSLSSFQSRLLVPADTCRRAKEPRGNQHLRNAI